MNVCDAGVRVTVFQIETILQRRRPRYPKGHNLNFYPSDGDLVPEKVLIDDDFARYIDKFIPKQTRVLCITDCCHSGSICDVDSFAFQHRIIALASAQDNQESLDMSTLGKEGGILTTAIAESSHELKNEQGDQKRFSVRGGKGNGLLLTSWRELSKMLVSCDGINESRLGVSRASNE